MWINIDVGPWVMVVLDLFGTLVYACLVYAGARAAEYAVAHKDMEGNRRWAVISSIFLALFALWVVGIMMKGAGDWISVATG